MNVPPTPNLQNLKLHGQKTKKKPIIRNQNLMHSPMRPKQHPTINTPGIYTNKSPKLSTTNQFCRFHPQKRAEYYSETMTKQRFWYCLECAVIQQANNKNEYSNEENQKQKQKQKQKQRQQNGKRIVHYDQQKKTKEQKIEKFMKRVKQLNQNLNTLKTNSIQHLEYQQSKLQQIFQHIEQSFQELILLLKEKQEQLKNDLINLINKRKQSVNQTIGLFKNIKDNTERYVYDINKHYEDIIQELELKRFQEVIWQYDAKIDYYQDISGINRYLNKKIPAYEDLTLYLPIQQLKRTIQKASVNSYQKQNLLIQNRSDRVKGATSHRFQQNHHKGNIKTDQYILKQMNSRKTHCGMLKDYQSQKNMNINMNMNIQSGKGTMH